MSNKNLDTIYNYLKKQMLLVSEKDIAEGVKINEFDVHHLLEKLVEDKYVLKKKFDELRPSYCINPAKLDFDGYESIAFAQSNKANIENEKMWYDTNNARMQFETYYSTRIMAIIACIVSVILLILKIIELAGKR